jgi:hypothetical protein
MLDRTALLSKIAVGDMFHANASNGASLLCLTMAVTATAVQARNVATQIIYDFDRRTGLAEWFVFGKRYICTIDSVAALPQDIHEIMLSLDQAGREGEYRDAENPERKLQPGEAALTKEQIRGLLFVSEFYPANPLPSE